MNGLRNAAMAIAVAGAGAPATASDPNVIYNECIDTAATWRSAKFQNCSRRAEQSAMTCQTEINRQYHEKTARCRDTLNASVARARAQARELRDARRARRDEQHEQQQ